MANTERIWQVLLPSGSVWIPADAFPGNPRASWIYARSTAESAAREFGGKVVEVTRRQQDKLLDREITATLAKPRKKPSQPRPLSRAARAARAAAILEYEEPLPPGGGPMLKLARESVEDAVAADARAYLSKILHESLWVGRDRDSWLVQRAEPLWNTEDPEGGEDPKAWSQIQNAEIVRILVEDM